jgi:hypothetical protein
LRKPVGGRLGTWGGKYKALIDGPEGFQVNGHAFLVTSKEHEDALRFYKTDMYQVVRCKILLKNGPVQGLTFRFAGGDAAVA